MNKHTLQLQGTLESMASELEKAASELRTLAKEVGQDESFGQVSEALMIIKNLNSGLPLDRLINVPIEALSLQVMALRKPE